MSRIMELADEYARYSKDDLGYPTLPKSSRAALAAEVEKLEAECKDWKDRWYKVCDVSNAFRNELEELKRTGK